MITLIWVIKIIFVGYIITINFMAFRKCDFIICFHKFPWFRADLGFWFVFGSSGLTKLILGSLQNVLSFNINQHNYKWWMNE